MTDIIISILLGTLFVVSVVQFVIISFIAKTIYEIKYKQEKNNE